MNNDDPVVETGSSLQKLGVVHSNLPYPLNIRKKIGYTNRPKTFPFFEEIMPVKIIC